MSGVVEGEGKLPEGWVRTTLAEVGDIVSGATPKTSVQEYWDGDIPWLTPDDLSKNPAKTTTKGRRSLTRAGYESCSTRLLPRGSVLFTSRAPIGYVTIAEQEICTNQGFKSITPEAGISPEYLYWYLQYKTPDITRRASGTTFKEISGRKFGETVVALPPTQEQHRIVEALEAHLSRLQEGEEQVHRCINRAHLLRSSLSAIAHRHSVPAGSSPATAPSPVGTEDGVLPNVPGTWRWERLGDIADVVGGVTKDKKKQSDPSIPEVPYLRVANVQRGKLDLSQVSSIRVAPEKAEKLALMDGDVLLNEGGDRDKLGRGWIWEGQIPGAIHQNHVFRARVNRDIMHPKLLSWYANSAGRWFEVNGKQSVNLASISLSKMKLLPVPVPPPEIQADMVEQIENEHTLLDNADAVARQALAKSAALRKALLHQAFTGRLVPQDPDDEPASVLLARIKKERAAQAAAKPKRARGAGTGTKTKRSVPTARTRTTGPPPAASSAPLPANAVQPTFDVFEDQTTGRHQAPDQDETQDAPK